MTTETLTRPSRKPTTFKKPPKSGYKGVVAYRGRWRARIATGQGMRLIGDFDTAEEAAMAYDAAAKELWGTPAPVEPGRAVNLHAVSGMKGVRQRGGRWEASRGRKYLGLFATVEEAKRAYDAAAPENLVDVAVLNLPKAPPSRFAVCLCGRETCLPVKVSSRARSWMVGKFLPVSLTVLSCDACKALPWKAIGTVEAWRIVLDVRDEMTPVEAPKS